MSPHHAPARVSDPAGVGYAAMAAGDALLEARRADLALAARIAAESRRAEVPWVRDAVGPTEAWRQYLADTDPEWDVDAPDDEEVAA